MLNPACFAFTVRDPNSGESLPKCTDALHARLALAEIRNATTNAHPTAARRRRMETLRREVSVSGSATATARDGHGRKELPLSHGVEAGVQETAAQVWFGGRKVVPLRDGLVEVRLQCSDVVAG